MSLATIELNSHNITISKMRPEIVGAMLDFCETYVQTNVVKEGRVYRREVKAVYAASPINNSEFRVHRNVEENLFTFFRKIGYKDSNFEIITNIPDPGVDADFKLIDLRPPKPHQVPIIEYVVDDGYTKVVALRTGRGKTFVSLKGVAEINKRLAIIIPAKYVAKWIKDVEAAFEIKSGDLLVVRGSSDLKKVINSALDGEYRAKVIIISSTTMYNYIKDYENNLSSGYMTPPSELFSLLGIGTKLLDECHQFLHLNFKMDLYTHVAKTIFLSATLVSNDPFINTILSIIYPEEIRMHGDAQLNYVDIYSLGYYIDDVSRIKTERQGRYSHVVFEGSLFKKPKLLRQYVDMIVDITNDVFIKRKQPGQKMLIFASTKDMCTELTSAIGSRWPELTVKRFVFEDHWDNLTKSDITVSTLGSAGTAVDVLDLKTCLMTPSVDSLQQNIQAAGRLRELVNYSDDYPEFYYLYCFNIKKQYQYHARKYGALKPYCRSFNNRILDQTLIA